MVEDATRPRRRGRTTTEVHMRICLMIEGQEDVSWNQWVTIAQACEDYGLDGLFRSDHFSSVQGTEARASLDAWTTLGGLAARTTRLRLGTLVSPVTFRHPSVLAKSAATVDHISTGRVELGMGAGWNEHEHATYGFDFPSGETRMEMLEEQIEIVHRQWTEGPFSFEGKHYRLSGLEALPKPLQRPHPPLIVGGSAHRRSAALAARWADEYNTVQATVDECRERRARVARTWEHQGRDPAQLRFSLMTSVVIGANQTDVLARSRRLMAKGGAGGDPEQWLEGSRSRSVVGTPQQVVTRLQELEDAGVERVMLQNLLHDDLEVIALLGHEVAPHLAERSTPPSRLLSPKLE
ncbi:MAG: TIGR03560 family F420-dependent LLM class oxidoreductase [Actinomycetota bacterium]